MDSRRHIVGLGDLPGGRFFSEALDVSADGSIVVGIGRSASGSESFVWDDLNGMRSLRDILTDDFGLDLTGWTLDEGLGVSDDGLTIVGRGVNPNGAPEAWIVTVPEPGMVPLLTIGALVCARRNGDRKKGRLVYRT